MNPNDESTQEMIKLYKEERKKLMAEVPAEEIEPISSASFSSLIAEAFN